ncbi:hypothetical protein [Natronobacterium lacisalsi]|uniref:hypothetical protein n=1 Tax=Natronobacterium lacisalsi TaxID=229731 RepID=UPI001EE77FF6|nr:hypothetical protein [Halobiforma lacisalsi]
MKGIGASIAFTLPGVAAADDRSDSETRPDRSNRPPGTGDIDNDDRLPIYASGRSIHEYRSDGGTYTYTHTFVSRDLEERYGDPVLEFESETIPDRWLSDEITAKEASTLTVADRLVIGTATEHATAERTITEQRRAGADEVTGQTHLTDEIPLYHYKSESDAQDRQARKAPINVGWEDIEAAEVKSFLEDDCDWSQYDWLPEEPRYVNDDGTVTSTEAHVMDRIQFTKQWHVRLYDIDHETYEVVGQAHRDPLNHNKGVTVDDWHFDDAREEIVEGWMNNSSRYPSRSSLENGADWDSHNGNIAMLMTQ